MPQSIHFERITALRHLMAEHQIDAYIAVAGDPHGTEYLHPHFKGRDWLTGFTGSRGTAVVTQDIALLWTDGRYFIQAAGELEGSTISIMRIGFPEDPTLPEWLANHLPVGACIGFDGMAMPISEAKAIRTAFGDKSPVFSASHDLIGQLWQERPQIPSTAARVHPVAFAGLSAAEKLALLRAKLAEKSRQRPITGQLKHLICKLDDIAWLFNLRGDDIPNNPYVFSFALVDSDQATLYIAPEKCDEVITAHLCEANVSVRPYSALLEDLATNTGNHTFLIEESSTPYRFAEILKQANQEALGDVLPTTLLKTIKNPTEQNSIRAAYLQDGLAMVRFVRALKETPAAFTEYSVGTALTEVRKSGENAMGNSFDTICGYREHGAMMHYKASIDSAYALEAEGLVLIDSGGQYLTGTTDITRTIALGPLTELEKFDYTITLKSMRYLADTIFMKGATGTHLDGLCRHHMWRHGLDYKCGTGHGLGFHLGVHEGPQSLSMNPSSHLVVPGMLLTDEPGVYREGISGVRIEDTLLCIPHSENAFGTFYAFENLTLFPYERDAILVDMLTAEEIQRIDVFHSQVYQQLAPHLADADALWLKKATMPLLKN